MAGISVCRLESSSCMSQAGEVVFSTSSVFTMGSASSPLLTSIAVRVGAERLCHRREGQLSY